MPRTRSLAWSELKIGALTIGALAIAVVLVVNLTGTRGFFWQRYPLKTRFTNVAGLAPGSPVRVAGVQVGSVLAWEFVGEQVDITFDVNKSMRSRITDKSVARLGSVSLLGEGAVDITPTTGGTPIPDWGYVAQGKTPAQIADIQESAAEGIGAATRMLLDFSNGRGTVGKLMTDDQLYVEMHRFVAAAGEIARSIQGGKGSVGKLLNDPKAARELESSLASVNTMLKQIEAGQGSLGKLLKDESFAKSLTGATTNLESLTAKLNKGEGTAGKLLKDEALYNHLNAVADKFDQLLAKLNDGQGTAGQLLKDKQLYENMNGAVTDLRTLVTAISKDPKKYLNVKVSIW